MNYTKGQWVAEQLSATNLAFKVDDKPFAYVQFPLPGMDNPTAFADKAQEAWGDVHIMLAAADLYEALDDVLGYAEEYGKTFAGGGGMTEQWYNEAIDKARKALAKAKGQ